MKKDHTKDFTNVYTEKLFMNLVKLLSLSFISAVFLFSQNVFAQPSDTTITTDVKSQLSANPIVADKQITVSTKNGVVTLSGNVNTDEEASKAVEIASSISGVKDTDASKLTIKESKQPFTDTVITAKVKGTYIREKLFGTKDVSAMGVSVETTNGTVYLTGAVKTKEQADNAIKLAKSVSGVKNVESKIEVNPTS